MKHVQIIGVDVSESSIKVLQLDADNVIDAYGNTSLAKGIVENGRIIDVEAFSLALNNVLTQTKPNILRTEENILHAVLCLPESKLFSHQCIVPNTIPDAEIEAYVRTDAQKIIPFELDTLYWNYHVSYNQGIRNATFVGVAKPDLENYVRAFTKAKVRPAFVGGELCALGQSLLPSPPFSEDYIILDIGAHSTTIGLFNVDTIPSISIFIPMGGDYFTQCIVDGLKISPEKAEQMKRQYGVNPIHDDTRVPTLLRECLLPIIEKISEAKIYFEKKTGKSITRIIIAGGSALLPYIDVYISEKLSIETCIADPLAKIKDRELLGDGTPSIFYANVIGLALCAKKADFSHINLLTQYRDDENVVEEESLSLQDIHSFSDFRYVINIFLRKIKIFIRMKCSMHKFHKPIIKPNLKLYIAIFILLITVTFLVWVGIHYL